MPVRRLGVWRTGLCLGAVALASLGAGRSAEEVLENEPPELAARLDSEGLVVLEDVGGSGAESFIVAYVVFEQPHGEVVRLLRQAERQPEYRTELDRVATVERFEGGRIDEQRVRIMFTELVYRLRYDESPDARRFEWKLDPDFDNDMQTMEGFWEFLPYESDPSRTLARFGSNVDVGPAVPRFIQKGLSRRTVIRYLRNCRQWIDSRGEWRP